MKIAIIGASGFLGTKLMNLLSDKYDVIGTYNSKQRSNLIQLDASNEKEVKDFFEKYSPGVVVNNVALSSSVQCEKNKDLCKKLNYLAAKNIAESCKKNNSKMVFFSSSYVFDGKKGDYRETDKPFPLNEYAKTKVMAEEEVLKLKDFLIIRVDLMYGYNGKNFPNGVFDRILSGKEIRLRNPKQLRQPVLVEDVVHAVKDLIEKEEKGIFHVAGPTKIYMIDFLKKLEGIVRKESKIIVSQESPGINIKIPKNPTLNISKIRSLNIRTHDFDKGLEILKNQLEINFQPP